MASSRKTSAARTRAVRPKAKVGKSARASVSSRRKTAAKALPARPAMKRVATKTATRAASKPVKPAVKAVPSKRVLKPVVAKSGIARTAAKTAVKSGVAKPAPAATAVVGKVGKGAAGKFVAKPVQKTKKEVKKLSDAAAKRAAQAQVRPLGVLPPESMMKSTRPATMPVARARPASPRARTPQTSGQGASRVTEKDLKELEARLLEERRRILKEMGYLENAVLKVNQRDSSGDLSGYSFHMADAGTDAMEREKAFMFASKEGRTLIEINEALRRVYRGEYGTCESCSQPIARGRLEAMPMARLCVACKEKEEKAQRGAQ
jgi:RNA polymerase-binding transcription factor DksA